MKKNISAVIGITLSFLFIYLAFRNVDIMKMFSLYRNISYFWLLPAAFCWLADLLFRTLMWRLIILPVKSTDFRTMFKLETIGLAMNNILPFRLGEIVRGTLAAKIYSVPYLSVFSTILVERVMDTIILFSMFVVSSRYGDLDGGLMNYENFLWTLLVLLVAALMVLVFSDKVLGFGPLSHFFTRHTRIRDFFAKAAMGVRCFHNPGTGSYVIVFTVLQWTANALTFYFFARAFSLGGVVDIFKSVVLLFTAAVAVSIPSMPGYFGNFEFALSKVMAKWDIPQDTALAYAGGAHVFGYLLVTALGLVFIYGMGHSLSGLFKSIGKEEKK